MNKRLIRFANVVLTSICITLFFSSQIAGATPASKTTVLQGEFRVAPSKINGSVIVEANDAPIIPLLQSVAQQTNRKIIISDEAKENGKEIGLITCQQMELPVDDLFTLFSQNKLSWGKVGQDTYLVVLRQKPADEKAEIGKKRKSIDGQRKEEPMRPSLNGRFWLLNPRK